MNLNNNDQAIAEQIKALLKKDLKRHYTHAELAILFHISETKLRRIFRKANNITIQKFVTGVRVEIAKDLLETTDEPVKSIAFTVGLAVNRLEKQFKKITEMRPLEWRKQSKDNSAPGKCG